MVAEEDEVGTSARDVGEFIREAAKCPLRAQPLTRSHGSPPPLSV